MSKASHHLIVTHTTLVEIGLTEYLVRSIRAFSACFSIRKPLVLGVNRF